MLLVSICDVSSSWWGLLYEILQQHYYFHFPHFFAITHLYPHSGLLYLCLLFHSTSSACTTLLLLHLGAAMLLGPLGGLQGRGGNLTPNNRLLLWNIRVLWAVLFLSHWHLCAALYHVRHFFAAFLLCAGMCFTASKIAFTSLSRSQVVKYQPYTKLQLPNDNL